MGRRGFLSLALALLAASCGWRAGIVPPTTGTRLEGPRPSSVGVELFTVDRDVLERGLEPILHEELSRAVTELVDAPLVAPRDAALVIRGEILEYRRRSGIRSRDNELLESAIRIVVRAELVDGATGEPVRPAVSRRIWSGYTLDDAARGEEDARVRAMRNLAQTLVLDLFRPLAPEVEPEPGQEGPRQAERHESGPPVPVS